MKIQFPAICLLSVFILSACQSTPAVTDAAVQPPAQEDQKNMEQEEGELVEDDDRGFDPCLLNSSLAVCKKQ